MCPALKVKKFEVWRYPFGCNPQFWNPQFLFGLVCFDIYPLQKFHLSNFIGLKVKNFGGPVWGGTSHLDTPKLYHI